MDDNANAIYARQESLGIIRDQSIVVVGCGGIGSWVGYFLGLAGVRELSLYDGDAISEHNLNRLPFTPEDIGRPKSLALATLIRRARPDTAVRAFGDFESNVQGHQDALNRSDRVVVSTDSLRSRRMVYNALAAHSKAKYVELGADGLGMSVSGAPAEWSSALEANPGYQSVPVMVAPCTMAASIAAYYILLGQPIRDTFRVDWKDGLQIRQYAEV